MYAISACVIIFRRTPTCACVIIRLKRDCFHGGDELNDIPSNQQTASLWQWRISTITWLEDSGRSFKGNDGSDYVALKASDIKAAKMGWVHLKWTILVATCFLVKGQVIPYSSDLLIDGCMWPKFITVGVIKTISTYPRDFALRALSFAWSPSAPPFNPEPRTDKLVKWAAKIDLERCICW